MLLVVADTSPLRYLAEIGHIEILPRLFERIMIPGAVYEELCNASTPDATRQWALTSPAWLNVLSLAAK